MKISLIVAVAKNGVIGCDGKIPWKLSGDMKRFKSITMGNTIIMGRKTYESIGRPLPGRGNIVVSRDRSLKIDGCLVVHSIKDAYKYAEDFGAKEAIAIGGEEIYRATIPIAQTMYITQVHASPVGDTFFPGSSALDWDQVSGESHVADEKNEFDYTFTMFLRK